MDSYSRMKIYHYSIPDYDVPAHLSKVWIFGITIGRYNFHFEWAKDSL